MSVRIGLLGCGRVGQAVIDLAGRADGPLGAAGLQVDCIRALVRDASRPRAVPADVLTTSSRDVLDSGIDVVVEVLGGAEPARTLVAAALDAGVPVVTANKTLMARHGPELRARARNRGVALACDAAVVAGVPFLGSLARRPHLSAVRRLAGIINGTSHFVLTAMAAGAPLDAALADAVARGYAEPDADADLSGRDAAEKLTVLLHLCGAERARVDDLVRVGLCDLRPADLTGARLLSGAIKPVALASLEPDDAGSWIGPAFVCADHPFAGLAGVTNALALSGAASGTVTFAGPGAGPDVTAAAILDDVAEVALGACPPLAPRPAAFVGDLGKPPRGPWFLRVARRHGITAREAAAELAAVEVPLDRVIVHAAAVYVRTRAAGWPVIARARARLNRAGAATLALPVLSN